MTVMNYSRARDLLADVFDSAIAHVPTRIERRRSGEAVLISSDDLRKVLEPYSFSPEVRFEAAGDVSIWLPELAIWGHGDSFASATEDLVTEVRQYGDEFAEALHRSPNHRERAPWVLRVAMLDDERLRDALFADPAAANFAPESQVASIAR